MRVETRELYKFEELSEQAKERARDWYRSVDTGLAWSEENRQSMEAFCDHFPIKATNWSYDSGSYYVNSRVTCDDEIAELSGPRLAAYIWNNYSRILVGPKVYRKGWQAGDKKRASRVFIEETSCPFTGYCMDDTLLDPIRKFLKAPNNRQTFADLLEDCLDEWGRTCRDDAAYQCSDEYIDETIEANEYEFTEDGGRA